MTVIVTDAGFAADDWTADFHDCAALPDRDADGVSALAADVPNDFDVTRLSDEIDRIDLIRVAFPSAADGRGFSQARQLRILGFQGRLRAAGPVIADQYAMARRSGFDEVEIPDDLAARQPEEQWLARADWRENFYQGRLRKTA